MFRLGLLLFVCIAMARKSPSPDELTRKYWQDLAANDLSARLSQHPNTQRAKNIIMFLGDGMSIPSVTAGRILKGQLEGNPGEEAMLNFDRFPHVSLSKTYSLNKQVADSASTATAYLCGVKANQGTIGVDGRVKKGDCQASSDPSTHLTSILAWAQKEGKSTGIVTTARITHASPAGTYAHIAHRDWESESPDSKKCPDIATQLIHSSPGKDINVILGGGRNVFLPNGTEGGTRKDMKNLIQEWKKLKEGMKSSYVTTKSQLASVSDVDYLLGLFQNDHLEYIIDKPADSQEPTLSEMTAKAIELLKKNDKGFFLFVEGGRIDHGHHASQAKHALYELVEMDKAIEKASSLTSTSNTLMVVTADHAHTLSINGYPDRGNDIFGFAGVSSKDGLLYTTLSYANGPGKVDRSQNLTFAEVHDNNYAQNSIVPLEDETHGGDDVGVFARGPWSHLYSGVHEQSYIPHLMAYAACLSEKQGSHCQNDPNHSTSAGFQTASSSFMPVFLAGILAALGLYQ